MEINIIKIKWSGPYCIGKLVDDKNGIPRNGIYQYIGIHPMTGPETLLYIGKTDDSFRNRINSHDESWFWDYPDYKVYLGELNVSERNERNLDYAESLLIYRLSPPYNSQKINKNYVENEVIVLNYGAKHRLPFEVSNLPEIEKYKWTE